MCESKRLSTFRCGAEIYWGVVVQIVTPQTKVFSKIPHEPKHRSLVVLRPLPLSASHLLIFITLDTADLQTFLRLLLTIDRHNRVQT